MTGLIHRKPAWQCISVLLEDAADDGRFLFARGVLKPQQQDPGVLPPPAISEILVHRDQETVFLKCPSQNLGVGHRRINVSHGENIVSGFPQ